MPPAKKPAAGNDIADQLDGVANELDKLKLNDKPVVLANGLTSAAIRKVAATVRSQITEITGKSHDLNKLIDLKNTNLKLLEAQRKQARSGVEGIFGDDSAEYAAMGGTKRSERKKPVRKPKG